MSADLERLLAGVGLTETSSSSMFDPERLRAGRIEGVLRVDEGRGPSGACAATVRARVVLPDDSGP